jgi:hypothetical protein
MLPRSYRSEWQQQFAQNRDFKEQGKDFFTGKRDREALWFYTQGVETKLDKTGG